jgi:proteasome activator subunit 4
LETAIRTVALSARALLHASIKRPLTNSEAETAASNEVLGSCKDTLELALMHTLSGLDANDPPKTTATLQLFCSIFSSVIY